MNSNSSSDLRHPRSTLVRPAVRRIHAYVPGEQPKIKGLIKLNTNENPYPPSPKVLAAIRAATDQRLRLYPNPTSQLLRERLAKYHRCDPSQVIIGNGSDDLLALATRAFVEPQTTEPVRGKRSSGVSQSTIQYFTPSYSLYPVLADIHGARRNPVPLAHGFTLPGLRELRSEGTWDFGAALTFITTPNAPTGCGYRTSVLNEFCRVQRGVVLLDEAYADFAGENAMPLALQHPNVLVARTFSKAYSLCFLRVGYIVGHPDLIAALDKLRDSYNVNGLGQVAALATLEDHAYYRSNLRKIIETRRRLAQELTKLGFEVLPSESNFIFARPPRFPAKAWLAKLRARQILVRWFDSPMTKDYLRITIGTPAEIETLISVARRILRS